MTQQQLKQMKKEAVIDHFLTEEEDAPQQIILQEPEDIFKVKEFKCMKWYCKLWVRIQVAVISTLRSI